MLLFLTHKYLSWSRFKCWTRASSKLTDTLTIEQLTNLIKNKRNKVINDYEIINKQRKIKALPKIIK